MSDERLFSKNHIWISIENDIARIGISNYAQEKLKSIMFLNLPDLGDNVVAGDRIGDIESVKTVSDLISPVTGVVVEINEALMEEPYMINEEPYKAWLVKIKISSLPKDLMNEETYKDTI